MFRIGVGMLVSAALAANLCADIFTIRGDESGLIDGRIGIRSIEVAKMPKIEPERKFEPVCVVGGYEAWGSGTNEALLLLSVYSGIPYIPMSLNLDLPSGTGSDGVIYGFNDLKRFAAKKAGYRLVRKFGGDGYFVYLYPGFKDPLREKTIDGNRLERLRKAKKGYRAALVKRAVERAGYAFKADAETMNAIEDFDMSRFPGGTVFDMVLFLSKRAGIFYGFEKDGRNRVLVMSLKNSISFRVPPVESVCDGGKRVVTKERSASESEERFLESIEDAIGERDADLDYDGEIATVSFDYESAPKVVSRLDLTAHAAATPVLLAMTVLEAVPPKGSYAAGEILSDYDGDLPVRVVANGINGIYDFAKNYGLAAGDPTYMKSVVTAGVPVTFESVCGDVTLEVEPTSWDSSANAVRIESERMGVDGRVTISDNQYAIFAGTEWDGSTVCLFSISAKRATINTDRRRGGK